MSPLSVTLAGARLWRDEGPDRRLVIDGLDLTIDAGERVALVGPNGAGKTTLLLALVGATPFDGRIELGGELLERASLERLRADVGFVFADPDDQLFLGSVRDEVAFGPRQRGLDEREVEHRVGEALGAVELAHAADRDPTTLSLGERRRLAAATVLSIRPRLVLFDEPTASLDPRARRAMIDTLQAAEATLLFATHDLDAALDVGARVVLLRDGRVVGDGPARETLTDEALLGEAGLLLPLSVAGQRGI